jgi:hypothetical protein
MTDEQKDKLEKSITNVGRQVMLANIDMSPPCRDGVYGVTITRPSFQIGYVTKDWTDEGLNDSDDEDMPELVDTSKSKEENGITTSDLENEDKWKPPASCTRSKTRGMTIKVNYREESDEEEEEGEDEVEEEDKEMDIKNQIDFMNQIDADDKEINRCIKEMDYAAEKLKKGQWMYVSKEIRDRKFHKVYQGADLLHKKLEEHYKEKEKRAREHGMSVQEMDDFLQDRARAWGYGLANYHNPTHKKTKSNEF